MPLEDKLENPIFPAASLAGGALGIKSGIGDLRNNNVFVSYGNVPIMGRGHAEPANQITQLLEEIRGENPKSFLGKLNIVDAPVTTYDGDVTPQAKSKLRSKFLAGIDTGWGIIDPERKLGGYRKLTPTNIYDRFTGENIIQRDPILMSRVNRKIIFQPDGRSDVTGYLASGDAKRVKNLPGHVTAAYGDFDPMVTHDQSGGKLKYMGRAHPLVNVKGLNPKLGRAEYNKKLVEYLKANGIDDIDENFLKNKKIITVSGASRGDTVGARSRWVADSLEAKGLNPDDYFIVGVGGADENLRRNRLISEAGGKKNNIFIGQRLPSAQAFNDIVSNSDLHVMGMGGATPAEALAHGGAPLAVFDDEQVFKLKSNNTWADGDLIPNRGIQGYESRLIDIINKDLPEGQRLAYGDPRPWMNPAVYGEGANEKVLRTGIDGGRDYLRLRGALGLQSDNADSLVNALNADRSKLDFNSQLVREDILAGRQNFKDLLIDELKKGKRISNIKGIGKLGIGATLAALGFSSAKQQMTPVKRFDIREALANLNNPKLTKKSNTELDSTDALGGASVLAGAGLYDTGSNLKKVKGISRKYINSVNKYINKYPELMYDVNPTQMEDFLKVMDDYSDAAKKMSNLRIMGVPARTIFSRMPISQLLRVPKDTVLQGMGLGFLANPKERWSIIDSAEHYRDAAKAPKSLLAREMLSHNATKNFRLAPEAAAVMSLEDAQKIINAPEDVTLQERFKPYIDKVKANQIPETPFNINSPFFYREKKMLRGVPDDVSSIIELPHSDIKRMSNNDGIKGYGIKFTHYGNKFGNKLKGAGAILAGLGLGTLISNNSEKNKINHSTNFNRILDSVKNLEAK